MLRIRHAVIALVAALLGLSLASPGRAGESGDATAEKPLATADGGATSAPAASRAASNAASPPAADANPNGTSPLAACRPDGPAPSPCAGPARSAADVAAALSAITLDDSKGRAWNLAEIAAQPVLLIVAGRKGSDQAAAWGEGLHRRHPDGLALWATPSDPLAVVVVSDADLHEVPGMIRGVVRWRIASVLADREREGRVGPPLLLDWEGRIARVAGIDTSGDAVVVLLDAARVERARFSGTPTDATLDALGAAIDSVRSTGSGRAAGRENGARGSESTARPQGEAPADGGHTRGDATAPGDGR